VAAVDFSFQRLRWLMNGRDTWAHPILSNSSEAPFCWAGVFRELRIARRGAFVARMKRARSDRYRRARPGRAGLFGSEAVLQSFVTSSGKSRFRDSPFH